MSLVPDIRIRPANAAPIRADGDFVLYWMVALRRTCWNFSLQRAVEWASDLRKPLLILEPLRCGYRWASDRLHHFVIQGMADNAAALQGHPATYYPYLEAEPAAGRGLLSALASRACVVISDDFPCFFLPRMLDAAVSQVPVHFELVDSNGLLPMRAADKTFARAHDFRRFLQKNIRPHLAAFPQPDPLENVQLPRLPQLPVEIAEKWPAADPGQWLCDPSYLAGLPIDHTVTIAPTEGGTRAAQRALVRFLSDNLGRYLSYRNQPEQEATSGLSPYLHFGHLSGHEVFSALMDGVGWTSSRIAEKPSGSRSGWWGAPEAAESFLDELITWREIGFNMCHRNEAYDQYDSLPVWAQQTLEEHQADPREQEYELPQFEAAATHDELWNAAQRQLVREGKIHNYLRMLWGKKVLEWTESPRAALDVLIELNNKYALDGRDPNSYSGIFWCLGRYDRAWGPERPIFGKIRYMSSQNTARKLRVKGYLQAYAEA